ncbi:MAG: hypothetical protein IPO60_17415 [Flavobacteriales bacterium]|jgi:hypothetical protein|nr:hypothetical protein [Flavobacteriales bacterium]MBK7248924.1 hypothetical protein [Flavobacteriales bacterium]MBK7288218.1 hypothetical protein [Flavobacteriales bacterium]MBK9600044.1 hypothetical protein [Flavobacteriales bacterium]QQS71177.1 MAG: hypothetical protein IPP95_08170 [Flavobacteriales bacterium]
MSDLPKGISERLGGQGKAESSVAILMLLFMLVLSAVPAFRAVHGLEWGPVMDFYRDGSYVHSILEGHYGQDPQFKGEHLWYTPLIFGLEALLVKVTGLPVQTLLVQAGPWLNLLAPVCFFIMAWYFRGGVTAVAATAIYLFFLIGDEPAWAVPTYTPWLIPISLVQGFFYLGLIAVHRAFRGGRLAAYLGMGALSGVIFMTHAAPALILVAIIAILTVDALWIPLLQGNWRQVRRVSGLSLGAAVMFMLFALPLLRYIVGDYGMRMINRAPFLYTYELLTLHHIRLFLFYNITWVTVAGLAGVALLMNEVWRRSILRPRIELWWFLICLALFLYAYLVSILNAYLGVHLPGTAPSFHYFFYMKAALVLQAGAAIAWMAQKLPMAPGRARAFAMLVWVLPIAIVYPGYSGRMDLYGMRALSLKISEDADLVAMFYCLQDDLAWDDVVLCDDDLSVFPLMPSARKAVATVCTMANPYVDLPPRVADRDAMMDGLRTERADQGALLAKYDVTHLLVRAADEVKMPLRGQWFPITVLRTEGYVLFARGDSAIRMSWAGRDLLEKSPQPSRSTATL